MNSLKQRRLFTYREIKISGSRFSYKTSYIGGENEVNISYENLSLEKTNYKTQNPMILIVSLGLYFFGIMAFILRNDKDVDQEIWIVSAFLATLILGIYIVTQENSWKIRLYSNSYIFIFKQIPDKKSVDEFILQLFSERNNYLKENYLRLDKNLSYETQFHDLKWLKNIEAISKEEFDTYYEDLKSLYAPKKTPIGFEK